MVLSILPTGLYLLYTKVSVSGFLSGQVSPYYAETPAASVAASFWQGWPSIVSIVVGLVILWEGSSGFCCPQRGVEGVAGRIMGWLSPLRADVHRPHPPTTTIRYSRPGSCLVGTCAAVAMKRLSHKGLLSYGGALIVGLSISVFMLNVAEHRQTISKIAEQERTCTEYAHRVAMYKDWAGCSPQPPQPHPFWWRRRLRVALMSWYPG